MSSEKNQRGARFATLCATPAHSPRDGDPLVVPLIQSTTFVQSGLDSTAEHKYSRVSNPTVAALERALGRLERAPDALCFSTGLAAETALLLGTVRAGEHVVCSRAVYGGTTRLLQQVLADFGVAATFADTTDPTAVRRALRPATRLVFVETPANPTLVLSDLAALADVAHTHGALLAVDNTFLTAVLQQPLELGADVSVYSTTKYVDGHSAALGGALVVRNEALREKLAFVRKSTGAIQSPFCAWLTLQGLKTLPLRIARQSENARRIAAWLAARDGVAAVHHPSLPSFAQRALADAQHRGAHGAVVTLELDGDLARARAFLRELRLCRLAEHVGSVETLVTHPATMTHASVAKVEREAAGIGDTLLRLSVGLEEPDDVIDDLDRAIAASTKDALQEVAR